MEHQGSTSRSPKVKLSVYIFALLVVMVVGYQVTIIAVRKHTDGLIQAVVGRTVPEFDERSVRVNRRYSSEDMYERTTLLHFYGDQCVDVLAESKDIQRLARALDPEYFFFLGISVDAVQRRGEDVTHRLLGQLRYKHGSIFADDDLMNEFHGRSWAHLVPLIYIVNRERVVTHAFRWPYDVDEIIAAAHAVDDA